jgi:hypothetical protein
MKFAAATGERELPVRVLFAQTATRLEGSL